MVLANPLDSIDTAKASTVISTNESQTKQMYSATHQQQQQQLPPMSYTTTSLTTPIRGIVPKLQRTEPQGIPIPGRAQSHDDIRMFGSGYSSPSSNYGVSPMSPRAHYLYGSSPIGINNYNSPPISCYGSPHLGVGNATVARRALSRATSPLSSSVPTGSIQYKSSSSRNINVNNNCSRSDSNVILNSKTNKKNLKKSTHNILIHKLNMYIRLCIERFLTVYFMNIDCIHSND